MNRRALLATLAATAAAGCTDALGSLDGGRPNREPYGVDDDEYVDPDPDEDEDDRRELRVGLYSRSDLVGDAHELAVEVGPLAEDVDEIVLEIDLAVLEERGVVVEEPALDVEFVHGEERDESDGLDVAATGYEDGVLEVTLTTLEEPYVASGFALTGLDASEAEPATDLEYGLDVRGRDAETVNRSSFDVVDLDERSPTVVPNWLETDRAGQRQRVSVDWLRPAAEVVRVDVDVSALEAYGSTDAAAVEDADFRGATVDSATVDGGAVSLELLPEADARVVGGRVIVAGIDISAEKSADEIAYEVALEGVVDDDVDVASFGIYRSDDEEVDEGDDADSDDDDVDDEDESDDSDVIDDPF